MRTHTEAKACPGCEKRLIQTCPQLVSWYWWIKELFPTVHISWSFRDEETQNQLVESGKSFQRWPTSKHNSCDSEGNPSSQALDLFELLPDGTASFKQYFYQRIFEETLKKDLPIRWGGTFEHLRDYNHFELKGAS